MEKEVKDYFIGVASGLAVSVVKWVATIGYNGKSIYLGIFNTYEEAVVARDLAEMTYYGKIKQ